MGVREITPWTASAAPGPFTSLLRRRLSRVANKGGMELFRLAAEAPARCWSPRRNRKN